MFHSIPKYLQTTRRFIYIHTFTKVIFVNLKSMLGHSCLRSLLIQTWVSFPQGWYFRYVVQIANKHVCVTFKIHSCPTTGNSKPDNLPVYEVWYRGFRRVRLCTAAAWSSWRNRKYKTETLIFSKPCWHKSHSIALITVHEFSMPSFMYC